MIANKYLSAVVDIKNHEESNLKAKLSGLHLDTLKKMVSLLPDNAHVRITNQIFDSSAFLMIINGDWWHYDHALYSDGEPLTKWFWDKSENQESSIDEIIGFIRQDYDEHELESETIVIQETEEYLQLMNTWAISFDKAYLRQLNGDFEELLEPDEELGVSEDVTIKVYPSSKASNVDLAPFFQIYLAENSN